MIKTLFFKDINLFFQSPMGFLIISSYWLLAGFFFSFNTVFVSAVDMVSAFHNMCILLLFFTPIITMRCFSEEYRNGTLELFLAYGVNECEFVAAKFLFLICILFILIAGSLPAVGILIIFSEPDLGPIIGGYLGLILLGLTFFSIGLLSSVLSAFQIVSAVIAWFILLFLWFIDYFSVFVKGASKEFLMSISFSNNYIDLIRGVFDLSSSFYFLSVCIFCLFLTSKFLMHRKYFGRVSV